MKALSLQGRQDGFFPGVGLTRYGGGGGGGGGGGEGAGKNLIVGPLGK